MSKLKPPEELHMEKDRLKIAEEKTKNVFKNKARIPDEQNHLKGGEPSRGGQ